MMKNMKRAIPSLMKEGTQHLTGLEQAVIRNINACKALSDITRTSFGPNGMNKMLINHLDKIFVTSDCATIMKEMEIEHPAAKIVTMAAQMQEVEIGDGSNFVVMLAGELLSQAEELIRMGLHPSEILNGYSKAGKKALEILEELSIAKLEQKELLNRNALAKATLSAIASKQYGFENFLSNLVASACLVVMPKNVANFTVDNVRVCKILGGNINQSEVIKGMVIAHDTLGNMKKVKDAKIAVFTCSIQASETETKGTVLINSADELMNYNASEEKEMERIISSFHESGVNVVVTGGTVDDIALHFLEKNKILVLKVQSQHDLRRLCKAVNAHAHVAMGPVSEEALGYCNNVFVREIGAQKITIFQQEKADATSIATILLRASTNNILNDMERAVDDGVNVIRALTKDSRFVAGAGSVDIELARRLAVFGSKSKGLDQYAIKKYAEALEIVPKTLAENAGQIAVDTIAQLYAAHEKGETNVGVNIDEGGVKDMTKDGVIDLLITKKSGLLLATEAIVTVLRVDQIISAKPAGGPKLPKKEGHWDDQD